MNILLLEDFMKKSIFIGLVLFGIQVQAINLDSIKSFLGFRKFQSQKEQLKEAIEKCDLDTTAQLVKTIKWKNADELNEFLVLTEKCPEASRHKLRGLGKLMAILPIITLAAPVAIYLAKIFFPKFDDSVNDFLGLQNPKDWAHNADYIKILKSHKIGSLIFQLIPTCGLEGFMNLRPLQGFTSSLAMVLCAYLGLEGYRDIFNKESNISKLLLIRICLQNKLLEITKVQA